MRTTKAELKFLRRFCERKYRAQVGGLSRAALADLWETARAEGPDLVTIERVYGNVAATIKLALETKR